MYIFIDWINFMCFYLFIIYSNEELKRDKVEAFDSTNKEWRLLTDVYVYCDAEI